MNDFEKNIINEDTDIISVMNQMNSIPDTLTLFVINNMGELKGTVTDGDIRRGFIRGNTLNDKVGNFMSRKFHFIFHDFSIHDIIKYRNLGIRLLPVLNEKGQIIKVHDLKRKRSMLPLEAMIMAGGRGKRLRPMTDSLPKPMLKIGNKPIIEHNVDLLISYGIQKIYISLNYLGDQIMDYLGDGTRKGISIEYVWEKEPLGTAGALKLVGNFMTDHIILMNSDLYTDINIEDLYLKFLAEEAVMGIASIPYTINIPYAIFDLEGDRIVSYKEKPNNTHYANAGIYIFEKKYIDLIPGNTFFNITHFIDKLLLDKKKVVHNPIIGYWIDIGSPDDYKKANEIMKHL
jgi:dTDP-glucose pyrophosphorylase